jgi:uncharacterized protein (DUF488 family)
MLNTDPVIFTIGHSNHSLEAFLALLRRARVTAIADVRSSPSSRHCPHFNGDSLRSSLRASDIAYVFLGQELGGRPADPNLYTDGVADYERMAATSGVERGLSRILDGALRFRVALLCSERDPLDCHRFLMLSRALKDKGCDVVHLLSDGEAEPMHMAERRLLEATRSSQADLFGEPEADALAAAYRNRARAVAYKRRGSRGR